MVTIVLYDNPLHASDLFSSFLFFHFIFSELSLFDLYFIGLFWMNRRPVLLDQDPKMLKKNQLKPAAFEDFVYKTPIEEVSAFLRIMVFMK